MRYLILAINFARDAFQNSASTGGLYATALFAFASCVTCKEGVQVVTYGASCHGLETMGQLAASAETRNPAADIRDASRLMSSGARFRVHAARIYIH